MPSPAGYEAVLASKAATYLAKLPRTEQQIVIDLIARLSAFPGQIGDYATTDSSGRPLENILLGEWHITYWADHSVKELRIVDLVRT